MSMRSRGADSVVGGVVHDLGEYRHEVCPYVGGTLTELSEILPKIIRRFLGPRRSPNRVGSNCQRRRSSDPGSPVVT